MIEPRARALVPMIQAAPAPGQLQAITIGPANVNVPLPGVLGALLGQGNASTYQSKFRYLGPITALMTIRESGTDVLQITTHPVASGANITDHSFMDPAKLELTMMTTNAQNQPWGEDYCQQVYTQLLNLQKSRLTFKIQTGKRLYDNMLMSSITLTNDETSEHALMLQISCQEIIRVPTSITPISPAVQSDPVNQQAPQKTAPVQPTGIKQAEPSGVAVPAGS
jgi:hypothetical protein